MFDQPNFTQTPNALFDIAMKDLNESELKVLLAIVRKTFGWKKDRDRISLTQIMELTGLSRPSVLSGIHGKSIVGGGYVLDTGLLQKGYIKMYPTELGNEYEVAVNESKGSKATLPEVVKQLDQGSKATLPEVVKQLDSQEKLSKETNQNKEPLPLFTDLPETPKKAPKPIKIDIPEIRRYGVYKHVKLTLDEGDKLESEGHTVEEVLEAVQFLDEWIEDNGKDKSKSPTHYLTLKRWVFTAVAEKKAKEARAQKVAYR